MLSVVQSFSTDKYKKILLLFLIGVIIYGVYKENIIITFTPLLLLTSILFIAKPTILYYILFASIPLSITYQINSSTIELPDELLMIAFTLLLPLIIFTHSKRSTFLFHPLSIILFISILWLLVQLILSNHILHTSKFILAKLWTMMPFAIGVVYIVKNNHQLNRLLYLLIGSSSIVYTYLTIKHLMIGISFETANMITYPFFLNHVSYSTFAIVILPFAFYLFKSTDNYWGKKLLLYSIFIFLFAIAASYTRTTWITLLLLPFIYLIIHLKKTFVSFIILCITTTVIVIGMLYKNYYLDYAPNKTEVIFHEGDFDKHLESTVELTDMSGMERVYRWIATKNALKHIWITGTGPATFYDEYKKYTESLFATYVSDNPEKSTTHNYFLLIFFEQGIIGWTLFMILIGAFLFYSDRYYAQYYKSQTLILACSSSFINILIHQFFNDQIETDEIGSIFYLCIGIFMFLHFNENNSNNVPVKKQTDDL